MKRSILLEKSIRIKIIQIKSIRVKRSKQMKRILMKKLRIENSIELKTALKCLFNKTKWKEHLAK